MKDRCVALFQELQDEISAGLEAIDGRARFEEDLWQRPGGGGGRSRVLVDGAVFERAGVNFSEVHGELPEVLAAEMPGEGRSFVATGVSLVLHPLNPHVPTVHANFRYIAKGQTWWCGGGADLTPYVAYEEDARHFHRTLRSACDRHDPDYYPRFKKRCDEYFYLPHRAEARGIGGIFFDNLSGDPERIFRFVEDVGHAFLDCYLPIVERRREQAWTDRQRAFQLLRRGRYVEFNLIYDRGTVFGLKTKGRTESILMSMPPLARWEYDHVPEPGSPEAALVALLQPRDWLS